MFTNMLPLNVYCIKKTGPQCHASIFNRDPVYIFLVLTALSVLASATAAGWFFGRRFFCSFTLFCIGATGTGFIAASGRCTSCHCQAGAGNQACNTQAGQQLLQILFVHSNLLC